MCTKLSVVIPVYNGESYIKHCIESIQNQSLKDIQTVIIDDGSTDKTTKIIRQYIEQNKNIQLIQQTKNEGPGVARNLGIKHSRGEYIAFLDVDDWMDMDGYLEMTNTLDASGSDIGICNIYTEYGDIYQSEIRYQYRHNNTISGKFALHLLSKVEALDSYISPRVGNKIFRNDFIKKNKLFFPAQSVWEDDLFTFLAFYYAKKVDIIPSVGEHYFQRRFSIMHSFSRNYVDSLIATFIQLKKILKSEKNIFQCEREYYAFLDRSLNILLNNMFANEQNISIQRTYICYLLEQLLQTFTISELVDHITPQRLARLWI